VDLPPIFDGTNRRYTAEDFLYQLGVYFLLMHITNGVHMVAIAVTRLAGAPRDWFRSLVPDPHKATPGPNSIMHNFDLFSSLLKSTFLPVNQSTHARAQLSRVRQTRDVRSYIGHFRGLCLQITDLSDAEKLSRFKEGLADVRIRQELELRNVATFEEAVVLAEKMAATATLAGASTPRARSGREDRLNAITPASPASQPRHTYARAVSAPPASAPAPPPAPAKQPRHFREPTPAVNTVLQELQAGNRQLTDKDRNLLKELGGCFFCRQLGHGKANCKKAQEAGTRRAAKNG
jgi:hypothetical protein